MPRPQPPAQEITAFQGSQRILGSAVEEASGDEQQVALIRAVSRSRQAVIYEVSALNDKWSGTSVSTGLTEAGVKLLEQSVLETASVTGTFGLLTKMLVTGEQALAYELQAFRDLWPDGLPASELIGVSPAGSADDQILTYDLPTGKWGVNSTVLISEVGAISKATSLSSDGNLAINTGSPSGSLTTTVADNYSLSTTFGSILLAAATTATLTGNTTATVSGSSGVTISSSGAGTVTIDPGTGGLVLPDLLSGILQTNGSGVVAALTGSVDDSILTYDTTTSQWGVFSSVVISETDTMSNLVRINFATSGTLTNALLSFATSTNGIVQSNTGNLSLKTTTSGDVIIDPAGNFVLTDLLSGVLYVDASAIVNRLAASSNGMVLKLNTGLPAWEGAAYVSASEPSPIFEGLIWLDEDEDGNLGAGYHDSLTTKTGAYTATTSDTVILCDTSSGGFTITLPTAVGNERKRFYIKKIDVANTLTVDADGSETIDGETTASIVGLNSIQIVSDGTEWWIL